jgi:sigma-B regulation protein RsbU (phosphoserine phosphatase)
MSEAQSSLADADAFYQNAPCALLVTSTTGLILKVNQTFCNWLGYSAEELLEQHRLQDFLTVGGRVFYQTHWIPLMEMQRSVAEVKLDFKTRDGKVVPMVLNAARRLHQGQMIDDVSAFIVAQRHRFEQELLIAKRQAEDALQEHLALQRELSVADARLRVAQDSAQLYLWEVDPQSLECLYDPRVAKLVGFDSVQPVSMTAYRSFIDPQDLARETLVFDDALKSSGHEYRCIYRLNGVDGVQRTVLSTGRGVFDHHDHLLQFVGVLHDITEVSRQRVMAEDRALFAEQMIGIVSHDLRNPLQVVSMAAQYLQGLEIPARQAAMLGHIRDATQRAQKLINDLLDFTQARIGQGLTISRVPIDLNRSVGQGIDALRLLYPGREICFVAQADIPGHADPDRLNQLVGNLISNAMAYGDERSPVTVTTSADPYGLAIAVHNLGSPIPPELLASIFLPMTRGTEINREVRSVGLGLFIVNEIAKAHGGSVVVTSSAGDGTTFTARVPTA